MIIRKYIGPSVTLPVLFVVLAGIPLAALGWLGWRLLVQDHALENQRLREQLENAATLLTREVDRSLATWEDVLPLSATRQGPSGPSVALPPNAVVLVFDSGGVLQQQGVRLPYSPLVASPPKAPANVARRRRGKRLPRGLFPCLFPPQHSYMRYECDVEERRNTTLESTVGHVIASPRGKGRPCSGMTQT